MMEKLYIPPKNFLPNTTIEFLRNVESIFKLKGKKVRNVAFVIGKVEKIEILGELVQTELFTCIHSDGWYSVYVPVE